MNLFRKAGMKMDERESRLRETGIRPEVLEEICALAQKNSVRRVILFGSRARGDWRRASDIDLAAEGGNIAAFALDVEEETSTLLEFDVVDLQRCRSEGLLESIRREGIVLYEEV